MKSDLLCNSYRCVEDHFEQLEAVWDERYQRRFGFWRAYVSDVIRRYQDCGDLHFGFARVKCEDCGHEYLLAFSCKRRHFCPSCHQKRKVLNLYLTKGYPIMTSKPARQLPSKALASGSQTYGSQSDFHNFNPHLHVLATDDCFYNDEAFMVCPPPDTGELEELFRHQVFKMLKAEGNITDVVIEKTWEFKGLVRPKLAQYVVIRTNLIGDHIYCPLFATIQNPFCNTAFLKPHMLFPIFS